MTEKPYVKLVPDKDVKNIILPEIMSFDDEFLSLAFDEPLSQFETGDGFEAIIDEGNSLKFLRVSLSSANEKEFCFEIKNSRDIFKREYERSAVNLEVTGPDFVARALNISAGGMQIKTDRLLNEKSVYDMQVKYDTRDIPVKYEVLRIQKDKNRFFVSGRFIDLDKDSKAFIIQQNLKNKVFSMKSFPLKKIKGGNNG